MAITVTAAGVIPPASATQTGAGVREGSNITVFHNIDFVAVFGYAAVGQPITVEVFRNDVLIGSETGPAVDLGDGTTPLPGIEVNHGPEGTPADGDCWEGHTPDIRPGDVVRVTDAAGTDEVTVDDITFSGSPTLDPVTQDVLVKGVAKTFDGTNIPPGSLDSGEFRDVLPSGQFRATPDETIADPAVDGGFIMVYHAPYDGDVKHPAGSTVAERRTSLLGEGHATGFGHVDPLPAESMLVDGIADTPGPALGCDASPSAQHVVTSVGTAKAGFLNKADFEAAGDLTVSGAASEATGVSVTVGSLTPVDATLTGGTWTATVPRSAIAALPDGPVEVSMVSTTAAGDVPGVAKTLTKDTVAPGAPTASPMPADVGIGTANVRLAAGAGDTIRYKLGAAAEKAFGGAFPIASDARLTARAIDAAGNTSAPFDDVYDITQAARAAAPRIGTVSAGKARATVSWTPGFNGNSAIKGYRLRAYRGNSLAKTVTVGNVRRATMHGLVNGARYRFRVNAINSVGHGALSAFSKAVRPHTVASSPRRVRALRNAPGGRVTAGVAWVAPRSNGGARVTGYQVRAFKERVNGSLARARLVASRPGRASAATVTLGRGTYRFQVRALNSAGRSAWSALSNARQAR